MQTGIPQFVISYREKNTQKLCIQCASRYIICDRQKITYSIPNTMSSEKVAQDLIMNCLYLYAVKRVLCSVFFFRSSRQTLMSISHGKFSWSILCISVDQRDHAIACTRMVPAYKFRCLNVISMTMQSFARPLTHSDVSMCQSLRCVQGNVCAKELW